MRQGGLKVRRLVESKPTPKQRGAWTRAEVKKFTALFKQHQMERRLAEMAKRPDLDKKRLAKNVAPAEADTAPEVNQQIRWYRNPTRSDFEGVDAPEGTATPAPTPKVRVKKVKLTKDQKDTARLKGISAWQAQLKDRFEALGTPGRIDWKAAKEMHNNGLSVDEAAARLSQRIAFDKIDQDQALQDSLQAAKERNEADKPVAQPTKEEIQAGLARIRAQAFDGKSVVIGRTKADKPVAKPAGTLETAAKVTKGLPQNALLETSNGRFTFIGKVNDQLAFIGADGVTPATPEEIATAKSVGVGFVKAIKTRSFASKEEALAAAEAIGAPVTPLTKATEEITGGADGTKPINQQAVQKARELGRAAFESGGASAPAMDREFMALFKTETTGGAIGDGLPYLAAWNQAFQKASLDAPLPEATELDLMEPAELARGKDHIIRDDDIFDEVTAVPRFEANLAAIRISKQIEAEDRLATPEEQVALGKYSGFGDSAYGGAFPPHGRFRDDPWGKRGEALKELVTEGEYKAIERSRLNAFYTTREVVNSMWNGLDQMGMNKLTRPRVLEPSAGSGRFLGLQPSESAGKSQRTAVELDDMTGNILKHLYPNADVHPGTGFEDAPIPNASIDVAISNVPFGDLPVTDREFRKGRKFLTKSIHNYFFAKTLDKLRPGGVMAFITSHHTLDAPTARPVREYLSERADFLGAVRLPRGAFPDTQVVTDIVYMRKRLPGEIPGDPNWIETGEITTEAGSDRYRFNLTHNVNQYFIDHPEMVLGKHSSQGSMRGSDEYSVDPIPGQDLGDALKQATDRLPKDVISQPVAEVGSRQRAQLEPSGTNTREGSYVVGTEGKLLTKKTGTLVDSGLESKDEAKVLGMLMVRDAARAVLGKQLEDRPDDEIKEEQVKLNALYDSFTKEHGSLNARANAKLMHLDPDGAFLRALEATEDGKTFTKMGIFSGRVVKGLGNPTATSPTDALAVTLNETGGLDFERMSQLLGKTPEGVRTALADEGAIFKNPTGAWEGRDEYLTGDVRGKLKTAELAVKTNPTFKANVDALKQVQPEDLPPSQIGVQLGVPWIPEADVNQFVAELLDARGRYNFRSRNADPNQFFEYVEETGAWTEKQPIDRVNRAKATSEWGTERKSAQKIIFATLNSKIIEVKDKDKETGKLIRNGTDTIAAQEKATAIQAEFQRWIWDDAERAARLTKHYNETFNNLRPRVFDGAHQTFPGMKNQWADQLHEHQKDAIWRVVQDGSSLLAHEVGFGKTAVMVAGGMELRRLGLSRKNVFVVPKATHAQFKDQFLDIYPYAKVLSPKASDFTPEKRPELMSRIATGDWDAVIMSHNQFEQLPVKPETEKAFIDNELRDLLHAMAAEAEANGTKGQTHKQLQAVQVRLEKRLEEVRLKAEAITDDTIFFEDLGIDQMFVDEADLFKNLHFITRMDRIKGLPNGQAQRADDMFLKVRHLQKAGNGRGVVFATGTPIANTVAEGYTMMRYLQEAQLEERGLQHFDAWARTFGATTESLEQTPTGAYKVTQRFANFQNVPELSHLWQTAADIRVSAEVPAITQLQPKLINDKGDKGTRTVIVAEASDDLKGFMQVLAARADNLGNVDPKDDNMLKIASEARMASLDMRLVDAGAKFDPEGKVAKAAGNIARIYKETNADKGTQLVFLDMGTPKAKDKLDEDGLQTGEDDTGEDAARLTNVYADLIARLVAQGVPKDDIAVIHDAKTDPQKNKLFDRVNSGDARILLGSTGKMGAGVNVQKRAAALHHLDAPWRPRDIEQREGRVIRQGNKVYGPVLDEKGKVVDEGKGVRIYNYVTENSFDGYMWQAIEAKSKAIKSLLRRNVMARTIEDVDSLTMSASEAKGLASGNPDVMAAVKIKNDISRLQMVKSSHTDSLVRAQQEVQSLPNVITTQEGALAKFKVDDQLADRSKGKDFAINLGKQSFDDKSEAGEAITTRLPSIALGDSKFLGSYRGFGVSASQAMEGVRFTLTNPASKMDHTTAPTQEVVPGGIVQRLDNLLSGISTKITKTEANIDGSKKSLVTFKVQAGKPFEQQERLTRLQQELGVIERRLQGQEEEPALTT